MQSLIKWYGNALANKDRGKGQKWDARLEAKEEGGNGIATRVKQPPREGEKRENLAYKLG